MQRNNRPTNRPSSHENILIESRTRESESVREKGNITTTTTIIIIIIIVKFILHIKQCTKTGMLNICRSLR